MPGVDDQRALPRLSGFRAELEAALCPGRVVGLEFEVFEVCNDRVARAALSWEPSGEQSSEASFRQAEDVILRAFDAALPRRPGQDSKHGTYAVLSFDGRLYFAQPPNGS
jgi:hypothetical protein